MGIRLLYIAAILLSAALLFSIQPIAAKLVLPRLGGSPSVWTTAMVFFQATLLAGYLYAHFVVTRLSPRVQAWVHGGILLIGAVFLPIAVPDDWEVAVEGAAVWQVLALFALMVGVPFFSLSANAPLLQSWYARTGRPDASDPYFLYAASNVGSIAALLGYPLLIEAWVGARDIALVWAVGYGLFGALLIGCAFILPSSPRDVPARIAHEPIPAWRFVRWIALAALPSSMMLSTTQVIATDVGSFPLLWVVPLSLYLLTFVVAFSQSARPPARLVEVVFALALAGAIVLVALDQVERVGWWAFIVLLFAFTLTALLFHMRLHDDRPSAGALTWFYLAMSIGGVLGGILNALVAPAIFDDLIEAPLVLILAGLILSGPILSGRDVFFGAVFAAIAIAFLNLSPVLGLDSGLRLLLAGGLMVLFLIASRRRPLQFTVLAVALLGSAYLAGLSDHVYRSRSFFGIYSVIDSEANGTRRLVHGTTIHGQQFLDELDAERPTSLAYYHPNGPLAQGVATQGDDAHIGIIGLGIGALACQGLNGQRWTFFEIDPVVDDIAREPALFTFMERCAGDAPTLMGDARLVLEKASDLSFDLLIVDAFSSDAIPIHLMTREAVALYRERLADGGLLMFHVSNRYFDLPPVLGRIADALGMTAHIRRRTSEGEAPLARGESGSIVVALSGDPTAFANDPLWRPIEGGEAPLWTDDHASLLSVLHF